MDTTPPRTAPTADASTPPAGPAEIPAEFRSQRLRHKEYKRRGPVSGSRFDEEEIGETRTALSSRFFDAADEVAQAPSAPPPPPPPPPPSPAVRKPASLRKRREVGEGRSEAVPAAAAPARADPAEAGRTATGTAAEGETRGGRTTEAAVNPEGALGVTAVEPRIGTDSAGDAITEDAAEDLGGSGKARAGGKRKVGPAGREERKSESPRKAADNGGRSGYDAVSSSERPIGEDSVAVEDGAALEPAVREPREDEQGGGQESELREGSGEDCRPVIVGADSGSADNDGQG